MSAERLMAVAVHLDEDRERLIGDIKSAAARAHKATAGDRADIVRYEALCAQLEHWAFEHRADDGAASVGVPDGARVPYLCQAEDADELSWLPTGWPARMQPILDGGGAIVVLRLPLELGSEPPRKAQAAVAAPDPAQAWRSPTGSHGTKAVRERFEAQIEQALAGSGGAVSPSGIQNTVLTEVLRHFVTQPGPRRDIPVEYRDGSRAAHPFPFCSLKLKQAAQPRGALELRLALLSVRHTEMDAVVDGAFLRNAEVSQVRLAAETDDLVYDVSAQQLNALTDDGRQRVHLRIYQTGLETAIVGFYRAVAMHLLAHPKSLLVTPMFFSGGGAPGPGNGRRRRPTPPVQGQSFKEAAAWAL